LFALTTGNVLTRQSALADATARRSVTYLKNDQFVSV
jgi:hypothetical protein